MRRAEGFEVQAANMFVSHSLKCLQEFTKCSEVSACWSDVIEGGFDRPASRLSALTGGKRAWNGCLSASMFDAH